MRIFFRSAAAIVNFCMHEHVPMRGECPGHLKAWFPYDRPGRPDRPSRLKKKCSDDRDDHMETLPRRSQTTRTTETISMAWIELSSIWTIEAIV